MLDRIVNKNIVTISSRYELKMYDNTTIRDIIQYLSSDSGTWLVIVMSALSNIGHEDTDTHLYDTQNHILILTKYLKTVHSFFLIFMRNCRIEKTGTFISKLEQGF